MIIDAVREFKSVIRDDDISYRELKRHFEQLQDDVVSGIDDVHCSIHDLKKYIDDPVSESSFTDDDEVMVDDSHFTTEREPETETETES
jgi:hypothetical protein